jgi:hypothetical protein
MDDDKRAKERLLEATALARRDAWHPDRGGDGSPSEPDRPVSSRPSPLSS